MMSRTVVIVDDDEGYRDSLEALLWSLGFESFAFGCGRDFLAACESFSNNSPATCVLLDYHLPDINGLDVLDALARKRTSFPGSTCSYGPLGPGSLPPSRNASADPP